MAIYKTKFVQELAKLVDQLPKELGIEPRALSIYQGMILTAISSKIPEYLKRIDEDEKLRQMIAGWCRILADAAACIP